MPRRLASRKVTSRYLDDLLAEARWPELPDSLIHAAVDRVLGRTPGHRGLSFTALRRTLETIQASLVGDSGTTPLPARGPATAVPRVLVYEVSGCSITVTLTPRDSQGKAGIRGHVIPHQGDAIQGRARLAWSRTSVESEIGEAGDFRFDECPARRFRLEILLGNRIIAVGPIDTGAQPGI